MMNKKETLVYRQKLIELAENIGYTVILDSPMEEALASARIAKPEKFNEEGVMIEEARPAGMCCYIPQEILVREGKGLTGQVCTLIHELSHALGLGGNSYFSYLGERYLELAAESVTQIVSQGLGIDRGIQTSSRIMYYGFKGYLISPVTLSISNIILKNISGLEIKYGT